MTAIDKSIANLHSILIQNNYKTYKNNVCVVEPEQKYVQDKITSFYVRKDHTESSFILSGFLIYAFGIDSIQQKDRNWPSNNKKCLFQITYLFLKITKATT